MSMFGMSGCLVSVSVAAEVSVEDAAAESAVDVDGVDDSISFFLSL